MGSRASAALSNSDGGLRHRASPQTSSSDDDDPTYEFREAANDDDEATAGESEPDLELGLPSDIDEQLAYTNNYTLIGCWEKFLDSVRYDKMVTPDGQKVSIYEAVNGQEVCNAFKDLIVEAVVERLESVSKCG